MRASMAPRTNQSGAVGRSRQPKSHRLSKGRVSLPGLYSTLRHASLAQSVEEPLVPSNPLGIVRQCKLMRAQLGNRCSLDKRIRKVVIKRLLRLGRVAGQRESRRERQIGKGIEVCRAAHPINGRLVLLLHEERPSLVEVEKPERRIARTEADGLVSELKREIRPAETAVGHATDKVYADVVGAQGEGALRLADGLLVT